MICPTESQQRDPSKAHLHPADNGSDLADGTMTHDGSTSNVPVDPAFEVEFKINAKHDLAGEEKGYERSEVGMNIACKLPSLVCVAKEPSKN